LDLPFPTPPRLSRDQLHTVQDWNTGDGASHMTPCSDHSTDYTANEWSSQIAGVMTHASELPNVTRTDSLCALPHVT